VFTEQWCGRSMAKKDLAGLNRGDVLLFAVNMNAAIK
jgi:hypothetical protein